MNYMDNKYLGKDLNIQIQKNYAEKYGNRYSCWNNHETIHTFSNKSNVRCPICNEIMTFNDF